jgi:hypothetical protein
VPNVTAEAFNVSLKGYGSQLLKYVEEDFLRDTLKASAVTLGTSARLHPWLLRTDNLKYF